MWLNVYGRTRDHLQVAEYYVCFRNAAVERGSRDWSLMWTDLARLCWLTEGKVQRRYRVSLGVRDEPSQEYVYSVNTELLVSPFCIYVCTVCISVKCRIRDFSCSVIDKVTRYHMKHKTINTVYWMLTEIYYTDISNISLHTQTHTYRVGNV